MIRLKHLHTGETGIFTYKRNGRYDKAELTRINHLLRDWRKNEAVNIDPHLLDLIWGVYRETGATGYIDIVCGYRSPQTNGMLRSRSRGVAQHSQHMLGKAIDFYIPGVPLAKLRETAMKVQGGGVGYYPTSGSPFVHMDTGNVRAWPRMTRNQLIALFPDGNTLHLPADGAPLPGYERALAQRKSGSGAALAYLETGDEGSKSSGGWLKRIFSGGADQAEDDAASGVDTATAAPPPAIQAPAQPATSPLPPAPAAPAVAPAADAPEMLLADLGPRDARVPRARPPTTADAAIAELSRLPDSQSGPDDEPSLASLAYAPMPRSRPDSALLAGTLGTLDSTASPLDVGADDAIAALAAQASAAVPEPPAPVAVASLNAGPGSPVDPALRRSPAALEPPLAYMPAEPDAPRRLAVASMGFSESGGRDANPGYTIPEGAASDPILMAALTAKANALRAKLQKAPPATPTTPPAVREDQSRRAAELLVAQKSAMPADAAERWRAAAQAGAFTGFEMPQPSGAPDLFVIPKTSASVAGATERPRLPAGRFRRAPAEPPPASDSFLSRLFASLSN